MWVCGHIPTFKTSQLWKEDIRKIECWLVLLLSSWHSLKLIENYFLRNIVVGLFRNQKSRVGHCQGFYMRINLAYQARRSGTCVWLANSSRSFISNCGVENVDSEVIENSSSASL